MIIVTVTQVFFAGGRNACRSSLQNAPKKQRQRNCQVWKHIRAASEFDSLLQKFDKRKVTSLRLKLVSVNFGALKLANI